MPAEAKRLNRGLGVRDRRFFAAVACAAATGTSVGALAVAHGNSPSAGCVTRDAAGVLGGGTWRYCGARAIAYCRAHAREDASLSVQCARVERGA